LNDKPTLQDLLEIQEHFGLPSPALVEKDWHVMRALAAIAAIAAADGFATGYATFCRDMVYGEAPDFAVAIETLTSLGRHLRGG
jgi:hypothetical protein